MIILINTVGLMFILFFFISFSPQVFLFPCFLHLHLFKSMFIQSQNVVIVEYVSSFFYRKGPLNKNTNQFIWELFWCAENTGRSEEFSLKMKCNCLVRILMSWCLIAEPKHILKVLLVFSRPFASWLNSLIHLSILVRGNWPFYSSPLIALSVAGKLSSC